MNITRKLIVSISLFALGATAYAIPQTKQCPSIDQVVQNGQWVVPAGWGALYALGTPGPNPIFYGAAILQNFKITGCGYEASPGSMKDILQLIEPSRALSTPVGPIASCTTPTPAWKTQIDQQTKTCMSDWFSCQTAPENCTWTENQSSVSK